MDMDMTEEVRIKVDDGVEIMRMGMAEGFGDAIELLEKLDADIKIAPGVTLAIAIVSTEFHRIRGEISVANLKAISAAGFNVSEFGRVMFDANTCELICEKDDT